LLGPAFTSAEEEALRRERSEQKRYLSDGPRFPLTLPRDVRAAARIEVTKLFRAPLRDSRDPVYFLQASKTFVPRKQGDADGLAFSGWVRQTSSSLASIEATAGITFSDDEKSHPSEYQPLGILSVGGRSVWVTRVDQYESALILLTEVTPLAVRDLVMAGLGEC
jgi:hypothetical protein